uniref:Retrotransposon protein n=1 Tax=Solanum tuberosum TaxID=4113 RepID=M1DFL9_SOLTU
MVLGQREIVIPLRRVGRGRFPRRYVDEQELPYAPGVQDQGEVSNAEFREAIRILSQAVTNQIGSKNFIEELKKIFDVMHVADTERVELAAYQLKDVARTWFDQWKGGRVENAPPLSSKEGRAAMLIGDMDISRLLVYVQQVEEEKLRDRKEFRSKRSKTGNESGQHKGNSNRSSFQQRQKGPVPSSARAPAPRYIAEFNGQNSKDFKARSAQSSGSVAQGGSLFPTCARCGRTHPGKYRDDQTGCFKCGQEGHFVKECPKNKQGSGNLGSRTQSSSVAPPDRTTPRGATSSTDGGANRLYAITSRHEQENSPNVITGMIKVFAFDVYALLDPGASLSFVTPYVAKKFDVLPERLCEPFCVSTPVGDSILTERLYRDYPISINLKSTVADLIELDMVDFDVILGMDCLHACYASIDCRTRVVKFQFPNEPVLEWSSSSIVPKGHFISYLKARKRFRVEEKSNSRGIRGGASRLAERPKKCFELHPLGRRA